MCLTESRPAGWRGTEWYIWLFLPAGYKYNERMNVNAFGLLIFFAVVGAYLLSKKIRTPETRDQLKWFVIFFICIMIGLFVLKDVLALVVKYFRRE